MLGKSEAFSGFSVDDIGIAKKFYGETLGLEVTDEPSGLALHMPGSRPIFVYPKPNHEPATFTILNFPVDDIDAAVDELTSLGVTFERYDGMEGIQQDEKGIARPENPDWGPPIAWFKDPAGNVLSVLEGSPE
ncbi:MAG: VOC family protein [Actinomycetota bacterium]